VFEYVVRLTDVIVLEGINSANKLDVIAETLVESVREILTRVLSDKQVRTLPRPIAA
jgi:succinyl-CoA synthetase beta subunit